MERISYISAGAGSGKTYTLTHLLAEHIAGKRKNKDGEWESCEQVDPEKVILTTYTKKAAAEFREKAKGVLYEEGKNNPILHDAAGRLDQACIGTVHSVANSFVQKYWYYLGLSPQQKVIAEEDVNFYISQSLADLPTAEEIKFLNQFRYEFNIEKLRVPGDPSKGSYADYGYWKDLLKDVIKKSETFGVSDLKASRDASLHLVRSLYKGDVSLSSDEERREVIDELVGAIANANMLKTKEELTSEILKYKEKPCVVSFQWIIGLKNAISKAIEKKTVASSSPKALEFNSVFNPWGTLEVRQKNEKLVNTIFDMAERWKQRYEQYKSQNHLLDYDDMERYMLKLLQRDDVREDISSSYEYLFVDEFQDSSPIQVQIFDELSKLMKKSYWVGDYKQAIFGFRGTDTALVKAVVDVIRRGENGNCLEKPLDTCWRSQPNITTMVNDVFIPVFAEDGLEKEMVELKPKKVKPEEKVAEQLKRWSLNYDKKEDAYAEIARRIACMVQQGVTPSDIAVLNNKNRDLNDLADRLRAYNLPVRRSDGSVSEEKEKQLLFALLALLVSKNNSMAMMQIHYLTTPETSLGELIDNKLTDKDFLKSHPLIIRLQKRCDSFEHQSVSALVESVIIEMDLYGESRHWDTTSRGFNILRTCIELARKYEDHCLQLGLPATISGYMEFVDSAEVKTEGDSDGVCLYTIHSSKGLEWKHVILTSLETDYSYKFEKNNVYGVQSCHNGEPSADNLYVPMTITVLPWIFGAAQKVPVEIISSLNTENIVKAQKSEAKRKLYVAMTRASEHLVLVDMKTKRISDPLKWFDTIGVDKNGVLCKFIEEEIPTADNPESLVYPSTGNTDKVLLLRQDHQTDRSPRDIMPSKVKQVADEIEILLDEKGQRIPIEKASDEDTMAKVGTCIHHIFCTFDKNHSTDFISSVILAHGMQTQLTNPQSIADSWNRLVQFLEERYGEAIAVYHERQFKYAEDGQIVTGSIDLVWKTNQGDVVVDYKSYPDWKRSDTLSKENKHYVGNHKGQLDCYQKALEKAGEKVLAKLIYYPVTQFVVEVK